MTGVAFPQKIDSYLATKIGARRALELRKRPGCRQRGKRRRRILSRAAVYLSIKHGPIAAPQVPVCFLGNAQNHFEVFEATPGLTNLKLKIEHDRALAGGTFDGRSAAITAAKNLASVFIAAGTGDFVRRRA